MDAFLQQMRRPARDQVQVGELNPFFTGTQVSRIRTKQQCRRQEYALLDAEALCALAMLDGGAYPGRMFVKIWRELLFTQFHDAVTGTHVDAAYDEIRETWRRIDAGIGLLRKAALTRLVRRKASAVSVINLRSAPATELVRVEVPVRSASSIVMRDVDGAKVDLVRVERIGRRFEIDFVARRVRPQGVSSYTVKAGKASAAVRSLPGKTIRNERFRIAADDHGIVSIFDRKLRREIAARQEYRPAELILEHDEGNPWYTETPDRTRLPLAPATRLTGVQAGPGFERLTFETNAFGAAPEGYRGQKVKARTLVTLYRGLERVDFRLEVDWDTRDRRLRVAFPLTFAGRHIRGIPYGALRHRGHAFPTEGSTDNIEYPCINWAGVETDGLAVAVLNQGVPGCRMERRAGREMILLSVLRSPARPWYLHEPQYYTMTDYDGMRDAGEHQFEFALKCYPHAFAESTVMADGESYNAGLVAAPGVVRLPELPEVKSDCACVSAMKGAERGKGLILRLFEFRGRGGMVDIRVPARMTGADRMNLMECQPEPLTVTNGHVRLRVRPWEIATIRLKEP